MKKNVGQVSVFVVFLLLFWAAVTFVPVAQAGQNRGPSKFGFTPKPGLHLVSEPNCFWWCYDGQGEGSAHVDSPEECALHCAINCHGPCDPI
jgi:hypothetical protein